MPICGSVVGAGGDAVAVDRAGVFAGDAGRCDDAGHGADVRELRQAGDDVADGVDAGLGGLHPLVDHDEAAVELDIGLVEADVVGARRAADGDQNLFGFLDLLLAVGVGVA